MRNVASLALTLLLAALLAGCSTISIVYNQADHVVVWMADDYFDLNAEQKDALRRQFAQLQAWHRAEQLPDYVAFLEAAKARVSRGLSEADTDWMVEGIKARYRTMASHAHPQVARLLATITDEQLGATRRQFEKANRKFAKEFGIGGTPEEQQRLIARRNVERIEHWTGPLTSEQEARVGEMSRRLPAIVEARHQYRIGRQQEFLALMAQRRDPAAFGPRLRDWLIDWEKARTPEYAQASARYGRANTEMFLAVERMLTPEQREHLLARLQRYIDALARLSREGSRTAVAPAQ